MKKAFNITIANMLFYIEEDAFAKLDTYLKTVRAHFSKYPDRDEIIADIEARIAEKFTAKKRNVITLLDVDEVVAAMGDASDFDAPEDGSQTDPVSGVSEKRLYRNTDDAIIAGVAPGIGAYTGIDTVIVRAIFIASIFFGGTGVLAYIILWIVMPEAKSATDKLMMQGSPVTLESVNNFVKDKAEEVKERAKSGSMKRVVALPAEIVRKIISFLTLRVFPILGRLVGVLVALVAFIAIAALFIGFFTVLFNYPSPNIDFPLGEAMGTGPLFYILLTSGFLAILIPVIFILALAIMLMRRKSTLPAGANLALFAVWFIALIALGTSATRAGALQNQYTSTDPSYRTAVREFPVGEFTKLDIRNGQRVTITQATTTSVVAEGRRRDLDNILVKVVDGTLVVERRDDTRICIFCWNHPASVKVTMPVLDKIDARNGSRINSDSTLALEELEMSLSNASRAELELNLVKTLSVHLSNASRAEMWGSANVLRADLENSSSLDAAAFGVNAAYVDLKNGSRAEINPGEKLELKAHNGSQLYYSGTPEITSDLRNGSRIINSGTTTSTTIDSEFQEFDKFTY